MKNVIYKISNTVNERIYIGSAVKFNYRVNLHKYDLRKGKHHSSKLQNHVNKYGIETLIFEVIEYCINSESLIEREQFYIDLLNPFFNILKKANSVLGYKHTEESKRKMVETKIKNGTYRKGFKITEETKAKIRESRKWFRPSPESIRKGVETRIKNGNNKHTEASKEKIRITSKGRVHSDLTKKKLSEIRKGEGNGMYGVKGKLHPMYGRKHKDESKMKMSKRAKKVIDTDTGIIYKNIKECCMHLNIPYGTMAKYVIGMVNSIKNFKYYEEN